ICDLNCQIVVRYFVGLLYNSKKFISDRTAAQNAVDMFIKGGNSGGTNIAVALNAVYNDLFKEKQDYETRNSNEKSSLKQYVFLLTDGVSFDTPSDDLLEDYKEAGIKIYTVGFGDADSMYLKRIADVTKGKPYTADSTSDLNKIFLKFNDEIEDDENGDKISDYYEYLMCTGTLKTKTGTRVFDGYTYEEVMANNDLDGDGLINGKEVFVYTENFKPYVHMSSNPARIYSDSDIYDDFEEAQYGTNANKVDFLIAQEDYTYLLNGSSFSFTKAANSYINESAGKPVFNYFVDVVFCGSESYFDTIKQGVQDGYYAVTDQGGTVGSENMLMKQDKALLAEYLGKIADLPDDQTQAESILETFMDTTENALDFYDSVESVMQFAKKDGDFEISDSVIKYLNDKNVQKLITDERREISKLQSELDLAKREARRTGTLTQTKARDFANRQTEISRRQSDIDRNVFSNNNSTAIKERYENISKKADVGLSIAQNAYSRFSQFTELVKYSQQLAAFEQYRDFITELSECYDDYTAEAARQILKELNSKERSNYWGRGGYEFLMGTLSDAADFGLDVLIDKCGEEVTAMLQIAQFAVSAVEGQNLSYERENLISADLSTQITLLASDQIQSICGLSKKLGDENRYYAASGAENCVTASQYMIYYVVTRQFGEEKYAELGEDRSGLLGLFGYNTLVHKYGQSSVDNAKSNAESLSDMAAKYNRIFRES
ncbi:MAG: VWA domain-containing protein, partial [Ruminococcus sp.]